MFDSKKEAARYLELKRLQQFGFISNLKTQVRYDLKVNDAKICAYVADFVYHDTEKNSEVVEDVKGFKTATYKLKKKLMEVCHGIKILET